MKGNAGEGPWTRRRNMERDMRIFDRLPQVLREALNYAALPYSPQEVRELYRKAGNHAQPVADSIRRADERLTRGAP